jgi:hypothetical protein
VLVAGPVVAHRGLGDRPFHGGDIDLGGALGGHPVGGRLQGGQRATGVAGGQPDQRVLGLLGELDGTVEPALVGHRPAQQRAHVVLGERLQLQHQRPGQQRRHHGERRVLGGRGDQQHEPVLDGAEQRVLLGLGEAVHLVDEQHGLLAAVVAAAAGVVDDLAQLLHPRAQGGQRHEVPVADAGQQPRDRRLAGPGRPVEQHRRRRAALDQPAQRGART